MRDLFTKSEAVISPCGCYRYSLTRVWDDSLPTCCWCMCNVKNPDFLRKNVQTGL